MPLMVDIEFLLPLLKTIEVSKKPRDAVLKAYQEVLNPSAEQTQEFIAGYLKASIDYTNACGALALGLAEAVADAKVGDFP